ncbi:MAG: prolyl oligopeptidase family serine peptidase [Myxococcota bacterium]|nr:prolyl oligopeptidase family serine peptidase [Myxococcota bacterium]
MTQLPARSLLVLTLLSFALAGCATSSRKAPTQAHDAPGDLARRADTIDTLHGVEVPDPYRWMEAEEDPEVVAWTAARNDRFQDYTDGLSQRSWLYDRFQQLWRYDDESTPSPCLLSNRSIYWSRRADQDKWVVHLREEEDGEGRVILDPNTWETTETLSGFTPSPDCRYAAFGTARAGDENPVVRVMDLDSLEVLPDSLQGWKQGGVSWLHDNSGFYYASKPLEGEVPEGEHEYWHRGWFHRLGTQAAEDQLVASDPEVKETWNWVHVSEDGKWLLVHRSLFNKNEIWLEPVGSEQDRQAVATGMDSSYKAFVVEDRLVILTDWEAPNYRVMTTSLDAPGRDHWTELIPETDNRLNSLSPIGGRLYANYLDKAATRIEVLSSEGEALGPVILPTVGTANVSGYWSKPRVLLSFSTFTHPSATYRWDQELQELELVKKSPIDIDPSGIVVDQVWYPSKDGTKVSMFVVHHKDAPKDGSVPFLLSGYGGFNISIKPRFSTLYATWIEAGGAIALPNLRGGGEYGRTWHQAGMRDKKQNVFDDFIAAAEWLEAEGWTQRDRLAISGGSNGGLLVSAVVTQRPQLFKAVLCAVPLTDMVRFHHLGLANIWTEEYGSADDPEMFPHILAYSPYHNTKKGTDYPAILVTGSANDARTDPAHARKFAAMARWADEDHGEGEPILLHIQSASGHGGAVTIDQRADHYSRNYGFLMEQVGLTGPQPGSSSD